MAKQSVSFLIERDKVGKLDSLAANQDRDRSYGLNEAVDFYLDLQQHHADCIRRGLEDVGVGRVVTHEEVGQQISARRRQRVKAHAK